MCLLPGIAYCRLRWPSTAAGFLIAQIAPRTGKVDGVPSAVSTALVLYEGAIFLGDTSFRFLSKFDTAVDSAKTQSEDASLVR